MALWQQLMLVILIGGIIGLFIAALASMHGKPSGPVCGTPVPPDKQQLFTPRTPLRPMRERQAELHARLRERSGHVHTVMIMLPPEGQDVPDIRGDTE